MFDDKKFKPQPSLAAQKRLKDDPFEDILVMRIYSILY